MMSFASWYADSHPRLVAALVVVCGNRDLAADAADEAMVRAFARWDRVREGVLRENRARGSRSR